MTTKLNALAFGYAGAVVSAVAMLILSVLAKVGIYEMAAQRMAEWHQFYSLSFGGIAAGIVESAVISFILGYGFAFVYNKFIRGAE